MGTVGVEEDNDTIMGGMQALNLFYSLLGCIEPLYNPGGFLARKA